MLRNPHHWTYKVPGVIVWSVLGLTCLLATDAPALALSLTRLLGLYVLFRVLVGMFFYPVGQVRCWWQAQQAGRLRAITDLARTQRPLAEDAIHHVVIVPNFREPPAILARTLTGLAAQYRAEHRLTVVLAMEAADPDAEAKARQLCGQFAASFARLLVTYHPANLPGELPGKGTNQRWAAQQARCLLVDELGLAPDQLTLTSCDADSLLHPDYFAELSRQYVRDPDAAYRFWQAPLRFDNNIWRVHPFVRVLTMLANVINLSELANPFVLNLTQSTYTFSYRLAESVDYWDTQVVSEDSHIMLRGFFGSGGRTSIRPIFLPTSGDAVTGDSHWLMLRNFYFQRTRHAWACQNTAYMLQQWNRDPRIPFSLKLLYLLQVLQDYTVFATAALVVALGWLLSLPSTRSPVNSFFVLAIPALLFVALNVISSAGMMFTWAVEHARAVRSVAGWRPTLLLLDLLVWTVLPVATLVLAALPVIHANTKMLVGSQLHFIRTQKEGGVALRTPAESQSGQQ